MCGIAGMFDTRGTRDFDQALMRRMNDTQRLALATHLAAAVRRFGSGEEANSWATK